MARAEELHVLLADGTPTFGVGQDVVKVEAIGLATLDAFSTVAPVNGKLDFGGNDSVVLELGVSDGLCVRLVLYFQLELVGLAPLVLLSPCVGEQELTVIGPDPLLELLVDANESGRLLSQLRLTGRQKELAVLG